MIADAAIYPELMTELDAIKRQRIGDLMLCRDWGNRGPWPAWPKPDEPDFTHLIPKVKEVIRAAGLRDELSFTSFRHGGFTEGGDAELTDREMLARGAALDCQGAAEIHQAYDATGDDRGQKSTVRPEQKADICPNERQPLCPNGKPKMREVPGNIGAGEGNRTLVFSLEGCCSTIELHPRAADQLSRPSSRLNHSCAEGHR